jgi:hypothetical protein
METREPGMVFWLASDPLHCDCGFNIWRWHPPISIKSNDQQLALLALESALAGLVR